VLQVIEKMENKILPTSFRLPAALVRRLRIHAAETDQQQGDIVIAALEVYLAGAKPPDDEMATLRSDPVFGPMLKSLLHAWKASKQ
jgi:hypothetical protein